MGKSKQVKKEEVTAVKKQSAMILATYKPVPRFRAACTAC